MFQQKKHILISLIVLSLSFPVYASKIVYHVNNDKTIELKWYDQQLTYPEGVYIYRQMVTRGWEQITESPIKKGDYQVPQDKMSSDSTLQTMIPFLQGDVNELEGLLLLNILVKSFQSEELSKFLGIYYHDTTSMHGLVRYKVVSAISGKEIGTSHWIDPIHNKVFEGPKDIEISKKGKRVRFSWLPETDRYYGVHVYRKSFDKAYNRITELPVMVNQQKDSTGWTKTIFNYEDILPVKKEEYEYKLVALDFFGHESLKSTPFKVNHKPVINPSQIKNLTIDSIYQDNANISWNKTPDSTSVGYRLYHAETIKGPFKQWQENLIPLDQRKITIRNLSVGDHYFKVTHVSESGHENQSLSALAPIHDVFAPESPNNITILTDSNSINLSWKQPVTSDLLGFQVFRSSPDTNNFVLLFSNPIQKTHFKDNLPKRARNNFHYKIVSVDTSWNKSKPSQIISGHLIDVIPPSIPVIKTLRYSEGKVNISWIKNREPDLREYEVWRFTKEGGEQKIATTKESLFRDSLVQSNTSYKYEIRAIDAAGNVSISRPYSLTTPKKDNNYKQTLSLSIKKKRKRTGLSWKWIEKPQVVKGYIVYSKQGSVWKPFSEMMKQKTYTIKTSPIKDVYYQVRAILEDGTIQISQIISR